MHDPFLEGNELIETAIGHFHEDQSIEVLTEILEAIRERMHHDGHFILPVEDECGETGRYACRTIKTGGKVWDIAFTSEEEYEKGEESRIESCFIDSSLKGCKEDKADGLLINPWGRYFIVTNEMIDNIFEKDAGREYSFLQ